MKKNFTLLILLLAISLTVIAQDWDYSVQVAATTKSEVRSVTLDNDTNLYVTAFHRSNSDVTTISGPFGSKGYDVIGKKQDILVIKLDQNGDTLWVRTIGGTDSDYPRQLLVDKDNNPYVAGIYRQADLSIQSTTLPTFDGYDIFLAHYTENGGDDFAKRIAYGPGDDILSQIALDNDDNIYMVGNYQISITFDGGSTLTSAPYNYSLFLAKFKPNGDFIWAKNIVSTDAGETTEFLEIDIPNNKEIYLGGFFYDSLSIGDSLVVAQGALEDMLVAKLDSSGAPIWLRQGGAPDLADRCNGISTDNNRNLYVTGFISGNATFDSTGMGLLNSSTISSVGAEDMFMAKYNPNGNLIWKRRNGSVGVDKAFGAKVRENILLFTGYFCDTLVFNNDTITTRSATDENPGFFVYDTDGNPISAHAISGNNENIDQAKYIDYDLKGNSYIGGLFTSDTLFIGSDILINASSTNNGFVAKYQNPFSATFSESNNITCPGGNNGLLEVTTYFGTGPYIYDWSESTGTGIFNDSSATNLTAGYYKVTITDALSKSISVERTFTQPSEIVISLDSLSLLCFQSANGGITTNVTGGTGSYAYSWSGVSGYEVSTQNQSDVSAGWYYVTVTDENSCTQNDSILVTEPDPLSSTSIVTIEDPLGSSNGSIDIDVDGGTSPYYYTWDFETVRMDGRVNDTLLNISEGEYTAHIIDENNCIYDTNIVVPGAELKVVLFGTNVSCYGAGNGVASAEIVSGDKGEPFSFTFTDSLGNELTPNNDTSVSNLTPGWYYVTIVEQAGDLRETSDSVEIIQPDTLSIELTPANIKCYGNSTGNISLSVKGGTPLYTYKWSNEKTTESIADIAAGNYTVTVTDKNLCSKIDSAVVTQPDSINISLVLNSPVNCFNGQDGEVRAIVGGGTKPYSYLWSDEGSQTAATATNLAAGSYTVSVTDKNNCVNNKSISLVNPLPLIFNTVDTTHITCRNANDGSISVAMQGGTEPYTYQWNQLGFGDTNSISGLFPYPAQYALTVTDKNGCKNDSLVFSPEQPPAALNLGYESSTNNSCYGLAEGSLTVNGSGGWGNYEYSLNGVNWRIENEFIDLPANEYQVKVRDGNNCTDSLEVEVSEPLELTVSETVISNTIIISAQGGTNPYQYALNGGDYQSVNIFSDLPDDTYYVEVTDANGCGPVRSSDILIDIVSFSNNELLTVKIYPNPSGGIFNMILDSEQGGSMRIEVFSLSGAKVFDNEVMVLSGNQELVQMDLSTAPSGVYMVKINGKILNKKLIKK